MISRKNRTRVNRERKQMTGILLFFITILLVAGLLSLSAIIKGGLISTSIFEDKGVQAVTVMQHLQKPEPAIVAKSDPILQTSIKISAAGDFTLGSDETYGYDGSFVHEAEKNDAAYFVKGLNNIFIEDDFTTVNLETTLTNATEKAEKKFRFKGDPSYAKILRLGGIEAVNLANNHIFDYLEKGYTDTKNSLENENIGYFGYGNKYITTIKDVKVGALGYEGWADYKEIRDQINQDIGDLKEQGAQIILVHFHWGNEREYVPTDSQKSLARYTIDSGADLVLGHHPHVVQGIEEYNGKFIVYSLGNFMFGGNRNPSDKDTFVFQQTFHIENGTLTDKKEIDIVPFSISSTTSRNNYQPTLLTGTEQTRVKEKIIEVSNMINGSNWLVYEKDEQVVTKQ